MIPGPVPGMGGARDRRRAAGNWRAVRVQARIPPPGMPLRRAGKARMGARERGTRGPRGNSGGCPGSAGDALRHAGPPCRVIHSPRPSWGMRAGRRLGAGSRIRRGVAWVPPGVPGMPGTKAGPVFAGSLAALPPGGAAGKVWPGGAMPATQSLQRTDKGQGRGHGPPKYRMKQGGRGACWVPCRAQLESIL